MLGKASATDDDQCWEWFKIIWFQITLLIYDFDLKSLQKYW